MIGESYIVKCDLCCKCIPHEQTISVLGDFYACPTCAEKSERSLVKEENIPTKMSESIDI